MRWNWQRPLWPHFSWNESRLLKAEEQFLIGGGVYVGTVRHLENEDRDRLIVECMGSEALTTSEIEGEILNRESVQSSIRRQLGMGNDHRRVRPSEDGIAQMTVDLYKTFALPIDADKLHAWHRMVVKGRTDLADVGRYRSHTQPMQIVSGRLHDPMVHFEAPPSKRVPKEMDKFIEWFNRTAPGGVAPLPALTRSGLAHLYFESIHPYEDGNGRVGRAIAEKSLAQSLGQPTLTALAATILLKRRSYYSALEDAQKQLEVTDWLTWFAATSIDAQRRTQAHIEFLIDKSKLLDDLRGRMSLRQEKALNRMLQAGPDGFTGGITAGKYSTITGASPATSTRDLSELVEMGALNRVGELRYTKYHLTIPKRPIVPVAINESGNLITRDT